MSTGASGTTKSPPPKRAIWAVLLALTPLAITGTALASVDLLPTTFAADTTSPAEPSTTPTSTSAPQDNPTEPVPAATGPIQLAGIAPIAAPGTVEDFDPTPLIPTIDISFPPPPKPDPPKSGSGGGSNKSSGSGGSTQSYTQFCKGGASAKASPGNSASSLLKAINTERARLGIAPLSSSSSLATTATNWSIYMRDNNYFDHNPNMPWGGENVGWSSGTSNWASAQHKAYMKSEGHCRNIMNPGWTRVGIGFAVGDPKTYTTFNFQ